VKVAICILGFSTRLKTKIVLQADDAKNNGNHSSDNTKYFRARGRNDNDVMIFSAPVPIKNRLKNSKSKHATTHSKSLPFRLISVK